VKTCTKCWIEKELENFNKHNTWKFWVSSICKDCMKISSNKYYIKNKDKLLKQSEDYYNKNKSKVSKRRSLHRKNNLKEYKERSAKYYNSERGKEIYRLNNAKRRALKRTTSDWTINIKSVQELLEDQGWVCVYCWVDIIDRTTRHLDHIHPISKGGVHSIDNVQWLCCFCNLSKWAN